MKEIIDIFVTVFIPAIFIYLSLRDYYNLKKCRKQFVNGKIIIDRQSRRFRIGLALFPIFGSGFVIYENGIKIRVFWKELFFSWNSITSIYATAKKTTLNFKSSSIHFYELDAKVVEKYVKHYIEFA